MEAFDAGIVVVDIVDSYTGLEEEEVPNMERLGFGYHMVFCIDSIRLVAMVVEERMEYTLVVCSR